MGKTNAQAGRRNAPAAMPLSMRFTLSLLVARTRGHEILAAFARQVALDDEAAAPAQSIRNEKPASEKFSLQRPNFCGASGKTFDRRAGNPIFATTAMLADLTQVGTFVRSVGSAIAKGRLAEVQEPPLRVRRRDAAPGFRAAQRARERRRWPPALPSSEPLKTDALSKAACYCPRTPATAAPSA